MYTSNGPLKVKKKPNNYYSNAKHETPLCKYCNYTSVIPSLKISSSATSIPILAIKSTNKNCNAKTCKHGLIKEKANTTR